MTIWSFTPSLSQVFITVITGYISSIGGWKFVLIRPQGYQRKIKSKLQGLYGTNIQIVICARLENKEQKPNLEDSWPQLDRH